MRGATAFMEGMSKGMVLGNKIKERNEQRELEKELEKAKEEATAEREAIISSGITPRVAETAQGQANAAAVDSLAEANGTDAIGLMGGAVEGVSPEAVRDSFVDRHNAPAGYAVKGIKGEFATEEEARKAAERQAPDFQTLYSQRAKDILVDRFTKNGNIEGAKVATAWAEDVKGKAYLKESANVFSAIAEGDSEALNTSFSRLGSIYGNGQDAKAEFDPQDPNKVVLTRMGPNGQPVSMPMTKGDLARHFVMQYNPEKGLQMHLDDIKARQVSQTKVAEKMFDHGLKLKENELNNKDRAERERANITLKAQLEQQGEDYKNSDKIDSTVRASVKHVEDYIGKESTNRLKTLEKELQTAQTMDPDRVPEIEAQIAGVQAKTREISTVAGEVASFAIRTQNPVLMDRGAAWHASVAEKLAAARQGEKNDVGLSFDSASGKLVEVYKENGKLVPITAPQDVNPANPLHQSAIVGMNNVNPTTNKPFVDAKTYATIKADYARRGGKLPDGETKPSKSVTKQAKTETPPQEHPARSGIMANRPSYQRQAVDAAARNS